MSVVHILVAHGQSEIDSIAEVGAEVEVIITDVTIVLTVDLVVGCRVVIDLAAIHFESLHVEVVEARIRSVVAVKGTVAQLLIRQFVGRSIVQSVGRPQQEVEVLALVVVEAHVDKRPFSSSHGIDEAHLVETGVGLVTFDIRWRITLHHQSSRYCHLTAAEEADTCRVRLHGTDVCAQRLHRSTHTDVACRTVEVASCQLLVLVSLLRKARKRCQR